MKITCSPQAPDRARVDALLLFSRPEGEGARLVVPADLSAEAIVWLKQAVASQNLTGKNGEAACFPTWGHLPATQVIVAGLGDESPLPAWRMERAAAAAMRKAAPLRLRRFAAEPSAGPDGPAAPEAARYLVRGLLDGAYAFGQYKTRGKKKTEAGDLCLVLVGAAARGAAVRHAAEEGRTEADALHDLRNLANQPGNEAPPEAIARYAKAMAKTCGLSCKILDQRALEKERCHALLAVARGSHQPPRVIVLEHKGRGRGQPLVLVGKTITFDSGGICLKPGPGMEWMKYDKCGGMAVLAAMRMAAQLRLPQRVIGILAVAENMPGGQATRPGDIVRARNGKTIEILNTDAEGRLVLADALSLAADYKPRAIVDLATLTGAVIIALGHEAAAVLSPNEPLRQALCEAGARSGDRVWPLPLWPEYDESLHGQFADLQNIGKDRSAGTIMGAAFLKAFAPEGVPWAHIDIAGTAWLEKESAWRAAGATLFGARLLIEWIKIHKEARTV